MRRLLIRGVWRLVGRRIGWVAVASVARTVLRRGASRQVDEAAVDLEQRLPDGVRSALTRLPGDPVRLGGSAVVAGRSARQVAVGAGRVSRMADGGRRRLGRGVGRAAEVVDGRPRPARASRKLAERVGDDVRAETEDQTRELRARMLANSRGRGAADDALLDRRHDDRAVIDLPEMPVTGGAAGVPGPPPPIPTGRRRAPRRRAKEQVARVQRTYQQPRKPWDR